MKRWWIALAAALILSALGGSALAAGADKLIIWADEVRSPVMRDVAKEFTRQYGLPVEVQEMGFGDIRDKLAVAGPAGQGPDIIIGAHDWLGQLVTNGLVEPLDLGGKAANFVPVATAAFTYNGKLYGIPYATEAVGLIYNKKLVPKPPATFDELMTTAKRLTDRSKKEYGFLLPQPDPYHTFPLLSATGGYVFGTRANGTVDPLDIGLANAGAVRGAELFARLIREGILPAGMDYNTMTSLFQQGKVGMMITGPWELASVKKAGIEYGFAKIPAIDGKKAKPFVGVQGFMVSAFSENKLLAKAFLTDFVAMPETMRALFDRDPRPPAYLSTLRAVQGNADVAGVAASAADGVPMPSIPEMASVWTAWSDALSLIINGQQEPKAALESAVRQIRATIQSGKQN